VTGADDRDALTFAQLGPVAEDVMQLNDRPRFLVFDLDGVLVRPWGFANALQAEHGISRATTEEFFRGPFRGCLNGKATLEEVLPPYLERWGWRGSTSDFIRFWMTSDDTPDIALLAFVERRRRSGDIVCLASNQERTRARYVASDMGFAARFDRLFFSCDLGVTKPVDAEFFDAVQRELGAAAEQVYFWDDQPACAAAARAIGWRAFVYAGLQTVLDALSSRAEPANGHERVAAMARRDVGQNR
jgi:putative hydrolase of the HAD superfamily